MRTIVVLLWVTLSAVPIAAQQVFKAGDEGVSRPRLREHVSIEYSEEARKAKLKGSVSLVAIVQPDGSVSDVTITKSFGAGMDEEALKAVRQWKFKAAEKDGKAVAFEACVDLIFNIL